MKEKSSRDMIFLAKTKTIYEILCLYKYTNIYK